MNRFSQLNANPSLRVAQTRDVGVAPTGFEVGPFSQLNHATPRPSSQSNPGALNEAHAFASLGDIPAFSQLNAIPSLEATWAEEVAGVLPGSDFGAFSQLNHANLRPSSQFNPGALSEAHAFASLGDILAFSQLNAIPSLEVTWAEEAGAVIGPKYLNRRSYLHVSDEPRTTRGSVHLEPKF
jgi:hypothetical protein